MPNVHSIDDSWTDRLKTYGSPPRPRGNLLNAITAFRHAPRWRDVLAYNEFSHRVWIRKPTPWGRANTEWTEADSSLASAWLQDQNIEVSTSIASEAAQRVAEESRFNPLIDYLTSREWDGYARVDTWLRDYLGVRWDDYSCAVGRCWLIGAVARVIQPGIKMDSCLILEGKQGRGKSSALRALAGAEYFSDYVSSDLGSKEASILCLGKWIIEFSELEGIGHQHARVDTVKSFLSRSEDYYRPPYGRVSVTMPRTCIFAATTNREVYMADESGNRRFWAVACGHIDVRGLERDRDQIWAEAFKLYTEGNAHWLDDDMERIAEREQASRYDNDPWQDSIAGWLKGKKKITVSEILEDCLKREVSQRVRADQMRVVRCLKALGWVMRRDMTSRWYEKA